jgi:hypothetical protein
MSKDTPSNPFDEYEDTPPEKGEKVMSFEAAKEGCDGLLRSLEIQTSEDYKRLRQEMKEGSTTLDNSPTIQGLNAEVHRIQIIKDRFATIFAEAHRNFVYRKRVYDLLTEAYLSISGESSQDKRRGDATIKLNSYYLGYIEAEGFHKYCGAIMRNLDSQYETLSRRITCFGLQLKLDGIGGFMNETAENELNRAVAESTPFSTADGAAGEVGWDD